MKPNGLFGAYKRSLKPNGLFAVPSKKGMLKPNGLFGSIKRNLKPNGLFGSIKRGLKPNGLFGSYKRSLKPNGLFGLTKRNNIPDDNEEDNTFLYYDSDSENVDDVYDGNGFDYFWNGEAWEELNGEDQNNSDKEKRGDSDFWAARGKKSDSEQNESNFWVTRGKRDAGDNENDPDFWAVRGKRDTNISDEVVNEVAQLPAQELEKES